jgi:hypothetical protein
MKKKKNHRIEAWIKPGTMPEEHVADNSCNLLLTPSKRLWISPENEAYAARPAPSLRVNSERARSNSEHWIWSSETKFGESARTVAVGNLWLRKESAECESWEGGGSVWSGSIVEFESGWFWKVVIRRKQGVTVRMKIAHRGEYLFIC